MKHFVKKILCSNIHASYFTELSVIVEILN